MRAKDTLVAPGKGANHPDVMAADARVASNREALIVELKNIHGSIERDLSAVSPQ